MRTIVKIVLTAVMVSAVGSARAQDAAQTQQTFGIEDVIQSQLDAFRARDVTTAYTFASPMIKEYFPRAQDFGRMVEQGYPMVWDNSATRFVATRQAGRRTYQQVMVQDPQGTLHMLEYAMIETPDGWKIDGVQLLPAPDVGV